MSSSVAPSSTSTIESVPLSLKPSLKMCFVGGKGGVGKTSVSCAIATTLAEQGDRVLVVSTDPAHSLFDALELPKSPEPLMAADNLWALEIDVEAALAEWRSAVDGFDFQKFGERYGKIGSEALKSLGIEEFLDLVKNPPPGIDELVGLARVIKLQSEYDKIVVDTAPTGHALRLLDLPKFADGFLGKLVALKSRLGQLANLAGGALGTRTVADDVNKLTSKLENLRDSITAVREALRDAEQTEFVVVTLPTALAQRETERLARTLVDGETSLKSIVVNRVVGDKFDTARYSMNQQNTVKTALDKAPLDSMTVTKIPFVDEELVGEYALQYFSSYFQQWDAVKRLVVCGGKGGVGKTTTAASLASFLSSPANGNKRVAVVSTDPAHSLGDALGLQLSKGVNPVSPTLDAIEIDSDEAARKASELLKSSVLKSMPQLADLADALETPPPGVDELVGLLDILDLLKSETYYDHVVVDTAPTGHTLRMLALPELLDDFAENAANARDRLKSNPFVRAALGANQKQMLDDEFNVDRIRQLQDRALALDAIIHDPNQCEFIVVAAPTELSVAETARLKLELDETQVSANRLVVNGLLNQDTIDAFAAKRRRNQADALAGYQDLARGLQLRLTVLPQFDTEVTGIWGIKTLAQALFKK